MKTGLRRLPVILLGTGMLCVATGVLMPERPRSAVMAHKEQQAMVFAAKSTLAFAGLAFIAVGAGSLVAVWIVGGCRRCN
jgi:hypothetical protein